MNTLLFVALFGALGCVSRYGLVEAFYALFGNRFPYGILMINVLGSFLIGFLSLLLVYKWPHLPLLRPGILVGFLGGFTTFSSFSYDAVQMITHGAWVKAVIYVMASVGLCLIATFLGLALAQGLR